MLDTNSAPILSLYGVGGLYNYGCEAIVRGTAIILRHAVPGAQIRYITPLPEDDARRITDTDVEVAQLRTGKRGIPLKVVNKIARAVCIPFDSTRVDYDSILEGADALVSIGGDIYTIPVHLREHGRYPYFNSLVRAGEVARQRGITEVVIGASVGPFGDYKPAVDYYADHLRNIDLVCCRERRSVKYLESIGVSENVCLMPDPAFFVTDGSEGLHYWDSAKYLGINLSPLSLHELYGGVSDLDVARLASLVASLMDQTKLPALLIPHVVSPCKEDNDLLFLRRIYNAMDNAHCARAEIVEPKGFLDAKRMLRCCRLVVAARMHCAVNAMCEGVPTILLSYSQKAQGMCEFVYGSDRWVLPLIGADEKLPGKLVELQGESIKVHESLVSRISQIRSTLKTTSGFMQLEHVLLSQKTNSARQ
ncbi:polysaccharide pyruvyl transferase family protein [Adlercreutzia sp. ZJ141]|uniref:polysaccharide pyruvyl transferase family protein n=1 Tax=Adlercreutzia sp. ZJ141 TaxID=2709406 RepID=UPI0013EC77BA|nr:polysaccharide pyruvyl transferase family protein [Adlercreutzia sp. ZJ141]